ncbi:MAG TPA: CvpA family protein [Terriglobales bacterium]|nr:CvpA family protein [Terriglobales bacterium]
MSGTDWAILLAIVLSAAGAAAEGFFHEAFGVAGLIVGYLLAAWQYRRLANWFAPNLKSPWLGEISAFLLIFFGVLLLAGIIGRIARWAVKEAGLSWLDRIFGAALGVVKGALLVSVVLLGMAAFTPTSRWLQGSQLAPYFLVAGRAAIWVAPSELRARFYQGLDLLRQPAKAPDAGNSASTPQAGTQQH